MDAAWLAAIVVVITNIFGWGFVFGKLNGRIKNLEDVTQRHEKVLNNGIVEKLNDTRSQVAKLEGTIRTFIQTVGKITND